MNLLVVDVGGSHVKVLVSGQTESRKFDSGPTLLCLEIAREWRRE
jgi:polyphosphate glucokinase